MENTANTKKADFLEKLRVGDNQIISEATGFSISYVCKVLNGHRNCKDILIAAESLVNNREEFIKGFRK